MKHILCLISLFLCTMTSITSCDKEKTEIKNPFFEDWDTPYGVPPFDRICPEHFLPAVKQAMAEHDAEIVAIVENNDEPTFANVIEALDRSGEKLTAVTNIFELLCLADSNEELQDAEEEILPMLAEHTDKILMNSALFAKVKTIHSKRKALKLTAEQVRLAEKTFDRFVRAGAELTPAQQERLQKINTELARLEVRFAQNLLQANNDYKLVVDDDKELVGLSTDIRSAAYDEAKRAGKNGKWVFTLRKPSFEPFMTYSPNRALREELYTAYINRCTEENDNRKIINDIMRLRTDKAQLLGYDSYADLVIANQMAGSPAKVYKLLDEVWKPAVEHAREEVKAMEVLFKRDVPDGKFEKWDWWYYAEKLRKQRYTLDEEMLRPYFSLENAQSGVFFLANRLYGITFRPVSVATYHHEVSAFEVLDADESHLGVLLFDFFPREGKKQGAWCGRFVDQTYSEGKRVAPVVSIVTNFTRPVGSSPALLTMDEVRTLFHEFGHALHSLFRDVRYKGLNRVEGDFVELPSKMMENWAFEAEVLKHYATHYRSREVIPSYMVQKIHRSRLFNQGFKTTELTAAALIDLDLHKMTEYKEFSTEEFENEALYTRRGMPSEIAPRYRLPYFAHIFSGSYSSGYYFYLWAEVLDKDAFEAFRESGDVFNRDIARKFRYEVLAKGGSRDGMSLYRSFRGQDPDRHPMLKSRGLWTDPEVPDTLKKTSKHPMFIQPQQINHKPIRLYEEKDDTK